MKCQFYYKSHHFFIGDFNACIGHSIHHKLQNMLCIIHNIHIHYYEPSINIENTFITIRTGVIILLLNQFSSKYHNKHSDDNYTLCYLVNYDLTIIQCFFISVILI